VFGPADEFDRLRESFAASRRREITFGRAWRVAMEDVPMGPAMRAVMKDTRHAWARAYNGHVTDADWRLLQLAEDTTRPRVLVG
jgi:hypothetical protein